MSRFCQKPDTLDRILHILERVPTEHRDAYLMSRFQRPAGSTPGNRNSGRGSEGESDDIQGPSQDGHVDYRDYGPTVASGSDVDRNPWIDLSADEQSPARSPSSPASDPAQTDSGLEYPYRYGEVERRVAGARRALADALAAYWADGKPPDRSVLRDGLLMLNAGHELDASYRALLLRAALFHGRGIITALSHQVDPERTAVIVHDVLVDVAAPFSPEQLARITREDLTFDSWQPYLVGELQTTARQYSGTRRRLAEDALVVLDGESRNPIVDETALALAELELEGVDRPSRGPLLALGLLTLAIMVTTLVLLQVERGRTSGMVAVPGGEFTLSDGNGSIHKTTLMPFLIDSMETTNRQYRRCVQRGGCQNPDADNSATHADYFTNPVFDDYPVVHVDQAAAAAYCAWTRRRLPTSDEWHIAASFAPATQRVFAYPWGDTYAAGLANDVNSAVGDLLAGGQYRPAGDSLMGLSDMAGNAAEWTATTTLQEPTSFWIKGGSFRDGPERLLNASAISVPGDQSAEWIGFRCATTSLDSKLMRWFDR